MNNKDYRMPQHNLKSSSGCKSSAHDANSDNMDVPTTSKLVSLHTREDTSQQIISEHVQKSETVTSNHVTAYTDLMNTSQRTINKKDDYNSSSTSSPFPLYSHWDKDMMSLDTVTFEGGSTEVLNILEDSKQEGGHAHNHTLSEASQAASSRSKKIKKGNLHTALEDKQMTTVLVDALNSQEAKKKFEELNNDPESTETYFHVPLKSLSKTCQEFVATTFDSKGTPVGEVPIKGIFLKVKDKDKNTINPPTLITAYPDLKDKPSKKKKRHNSAPNVKISTQDTNVKK